MPDMELPKYRCHKEVWALKIAAVSIPGLGPNEETDGSKVLMPEDKRYAPFKVDPDYVRKHDPQPGGYYVVYKGGYKSFSPADAFEEGYTLIP